MKRGLVFGLLAIGISALDAGAEPANDEAVNRGDPLKELDRIFDEAVAEGILTPSENVRSSGELTGDSRPEPTDGACTTGDLLDFAAHKRLSRYEDVFMIKSAASEGDTDIAGLDLSLGFIAIGLYQEAAAEAPEGREGEIIKAVSSLLGDRTPNTPFFRDLAGCHDEGLLWLALSNLVDGYSEGVQLLRDSLGEFRNLPLQIRIDATVLAVPALIAEGEDTLVSMLMASFTREQIASSSALRFALALAEVERGLPQSGAQLEEFLLDARFKDEALVALLRSAAPLNAAQREILVDDVRKTLEQVATTQGMEAELAFLVEYYARKSAYDPLMELARLPSLQNNAAREIVEDHIVRSLQRDLASKEPLLRLGALKAIDKLHETPFALPGDHILFEQAARVSSRYGLLSLVQGAGDQQEMTGELAANVARLAARRGDCEAAAGAAARLDTAILKRLAAICWIRDGNAAEAEIWLRKIEPDTETAIAIAKADQIAGTGIVSDRYYRILEDAAETGQSVNAQRLVEMRRQTTATPKPMPSLESFAAQLSQTRSSMQLLQERLD